MGGRGGAPAVITLARAVRTCIACPSQWDAWDAAGNYYYLRYRHGHGSVRSYPSAEWTGPGVMVAEFAYGDHLDGSMDLGEFAEHAGLALAPGVAAEADGPMIAAWQQMDLEAGDGT